MKRLVLLVALLTPAPLVAHPLDGLATDEYWIIYDAVQSTGHLTPETEFTSVLLRPPTKATVLAWKPFHFEKNPVLDLPKSLAGQ